MKCFPKNMEVYVSSSNSPTFNCALEEYLLTQTERELMVLYINSPSVIIGRNQSLEAEVNVPFCDERGIEVVRRISGGGAVYHDFGNVNYSFILDRGDIPLLDQNFNTPIIDALDSLNVKAHAGFRKELLVGEYKISGTAAHVAKSRQLFHGTLLFNSDLKTLDASLRGDVNKLGRCVASIRSEVINLSELISTIESADEFMMVLEGFFREYYNSPNQNELAPLDLDGVSVIQKARFGGVSF